MPTLPAGTQFVALIGDIVGSRRLENRAVVQAKLLDILDRLNRELDAAKLAAPLTLTAGDEIQALLRHPTDVVVVVQELTDRAFGISDSPEILFGVGRGALTTGSVAKRPSTRTPTLNPALLDGPAFHRARTALESAQRAKVWAKFEGFGRHEDQVLDALFQLMGAVRSRWTARQALVSYYSRTRSQQKFLAEELGVSPSVVSESLKAANHEALIAGEAAAERILTRVNDGLATHG